MTTRVAICVADLVDGGVGMGGGRHGGGGGRRDGREAGPDAQLVFAVEVEGLFAAGVFAPPGKGDGTVQGQLDVAQGAAVGEPVVDGAVFGVG